MGVPDPRRGLARLPSPPVGGYSCGVWLPAEPFMLPIPCLWVFVDDNGAGTLAECDEENNSAIEKPPFCE